METKRTYMFCVAFAADPKPVVICSFVTQFDDHIFVAMDAEAVFFLHDLVINYVKEKDRGTVHYINVQYLNNTVCSSEFT